MGTQVRLAKTGGGVGWAGNCYCSEIGDHTVSPIQINLPGC